MKTHHARTVRFSETEDGTYRAMEYNGVPLCLILEPNDRGNGKNSCIPPGRYICKRHQGTRYPDTWCIKNVPNRKYILFHWGNIEDDSLGCLLTGSKLGVYKGKLGLYESKKAFKELMRLSKNADKIILTISECF